MKAPEVYKIRFQLVRVHTTPEGPSVEALDSFLMDTPERVRGVYSNKTEAPYLVARGFFENMKKRLSK